MKQTQKCYAWEEVVMDVKRGPDWGSAVVVVIGELFGMCKRDSISAMDHVLRHSCNSTSLQ